MNFISGTLLGLLIGILLGTHYTHKARRYWQWRRGRKLQLIAERNEMKGYRYKRKRPMLSCWQKFLLGWLHSINPTLTRYTNFRPETLVGWHRRFVKRWWWMLVIAGGKQRTAGRPRVDASVEKIIADIKADNPSYGSKRISLMVTVQLGVEVSQTTVRNILKRLQRQPTKPKAPEGSQRWKTFLYNHRDSMASMDFKVTFDWWGKLLYILNIIDHERRELVVSRATYNPSSDWVAQQIRDAYPFNEAPKRMLMDHDSIFLPLVHHTLPNMGIKVIRSSVGCPWQNAVVERFNRTLTEHLWLHQKQQFHRNLASQTRCGYSIARKMVGEINTPFQGWR